MHIYHSLAVGLDRPLFHVPIRPCYQGARSADPQHVPQPVPVHGHLVHARGGRQQEPQGAGAVCVRVCGALLTVSALVLRLCRVVRKLSLWLLFISSPFSGAGLSVCCLMLLAGGSACLLRLMRLLREGSNSRAPHTRRLQSRRYLGFRPPAGSARVENEGV